MLEFRRFDGACTVLMLTKEGGCVESPKGRENIVRLGNEPDGESGVFG